MSAHRLRVLETTDSLRFSEGEILRCKTKEDAADMADLIRDAGGDVEELETLMADGGPNRGGRR